MKREPSIQELESTKDRLLQALRLPDRLAAGDKPDYLEHVDLDTVIPLLLRTVSASGPIQSDPEVTEFFADFIQRSEDGLRECLQSDIALLERARDTGEDQVAHTAFGMLEAVFPVTVHGEVVHCVWCGKLRDKPFSREEIEAISNVSGADLKRVEQAAAAIPVLDPGQTAMVHEVCRALRDAVQELLVQRIRSAQANLQLLQSERIRSLGTLSGGVAHHFNNLLSVILGYSSFVLNREDHSAEAADALHKITEAAQRGRRLTEEILSFAGSEAEEEVACRVHEMLTSVLSLLESQLSSQIRIERKLDASNDVVLSEPSSIHQIIFNLLSNALDGMPAGGVLTVSTSNTELDTEAGAREEFLKLTITDNSGVLPVGMPESDQEKFLSQAAPSSDRSELRLSSVYGMVGRLDGTVTVSSDPGAMTRVEVLLPSASEGAEPAPEKKVRRRLAPSEIWVIDDDPIFREMCNQVLHEEGHEIKEITGGPELQNQWKKKTAAPDLLLIDFSMPEYNGLELCEWLRGEGSTVPVILVSGFAPNQPDIKKALRIKKTYFLQKPFTSRDLTDTVTVAMGETLIGD